MEILFTFYPEDTPFRQMLLKHSYQVCGKALELTDACGYDVLGVTTDDGRITLGGEPFYFSKDFLISSEVCRICAVLLSFVSVVFLPPPYLSITPLYCVCCLGSRSLMARLTWYCT